jgi:hypothetical protein
MEFVSIGGEHQLVAGMGQPGEKNQTHKADFIGPTQRRSTEMKQAEMKRVAGMKLGSLSWPATT